MKKTAKKTCLYNKVQNIEQVEKQPKKSRKSNKKARDYSFDLEDYTDEEIELLESVGF